jgi:diguanylate cyclase (GGDEF)-like protein
MNLAAELHARVLDALGSGVALIDAAQVVLAWNASFARFTGVSGERAVGRAVGDLVDALGSPRASAALRRALEHGMTSVLSAALRPGSRGEDEPEVRAKPGFSFMLQPISLGGERYCLIELRDLSAVAELEASLQAEVKKTKALERELSFIELELGRATRVDPVTGLANRVALNEELEARLAQRAQGALFFLDLDRFNLIQGTLGDRNAEVLIRQFVDRLRSLVRPSDLVCRLGLDEFGILCDGLAAPEDALRLGERLTVALCQPMELSGQTLFPSVSLGCSSFPADGHDVDLLTANAATALGRAKEEGGGICLAHSAALQAANGQKMLLSAELRRAVAKRKLKLVYQPQTSVACGRVLGVEALLRWDHPTRGPVSPAEFVPILEESGLILDVGAWVLEEACQQLAAWDRAGLAIPRMAVNVSARQFRDHDLVGAVNAALQKSGIDGTRLELELTEGMLMRDAESSRQTLETLAARGLHLAIDDFGTGYSSLGYLKRFPVDTLKIDRVFVKELKEDTDDHAIVSAVISLGHMLGLHVIAEGVETEAQLELLREAGCDAMQGYLRARPMPPEQLERWAAERAEEGTESVPAPASIQA